MNPYQNLSESAFWKPAVAQRNFLEIQDIWEPKYLIHQKFRIATFGSCFAQHIGRAFSGNGFLWYDAEPAHPSMDESSAQRFNYGIFSARTGNIYTTSLLKQWAEWALGKAVPPEEFWEKDGRVFDPFRPAIEPNGFDSIEEARMSRDCTIEAFRDCIVKSHIFVFTLGLTESWFNAAQNYEYPMCPGTVAGEFDESVHKFTNQTYPVIYQNLKKAISLMRQVNPKLRFLLTVSPVPLTATKSDQHVLVATMYSKSVLRAVAGCLAGSDRLVDYFPSYEIINSPVFKGAFFEPNLRNVSAYGVRFVMNTFFECLRKKYGGKAFNNPVNAKAGKPEGVDDVCEELILEAFSTR